ncbi:MAG: SDR family NAD(P)-dependent oxidoreductase [Rhodobacteraceae bacterium]|nr:SDR family NAD(P)-dependent oxidoreductase [Paracoccaceae bacterium]
MAEKIVVTGATSGLGRALVFALAEAGYQPVPTGRNAQKVAALAAELGVAGYTLDVSDPAAISAVSAQITQELGPIDGLINNAGIWLEGDFETYSAPQIQAVIDTNTTGTILMTHALLPDMLARGQGTVINTISTGALYSRKLISVYAASKWAIRGFTGCLEVECAPKGVRVMGFYPGKIASNMYETAGIERDLDMAMTPEQGAAMVLAMLQDKGMVWSHVSGRSINDYV